MRVALATDGLFPQVPGGMARHSVFLTRGLADAGMSVHVFHPGPAKVFDRPHVMETIVPMPRRGFKGHYFWELWEYSKRVEAAIKDAGDADVVYGQGAATWAYLRDRDVPVIVNPHGLEMFQPIGWRQVARSWPMRPVMKRQVTSADRTVSLGGHLTRILVEHCRVPRHKVVKIPNAVDLRYIDGLGLDLDEPREGFVFVGRLVPNKGIPELLDAFASLAGSGVGLSVIGDGPLRGELERAAGRGVRFLGAVSEQELFEKLAASEAFVFSSLGEGMPTVILEAMACGLPVIATDVGATSWLVDRANGFLVRPGSSDDLQAAMRSFLELSPSERRRLGAASRERVEQRFTWSRVARITSQALEDLVATSSTS